MANPLTLLVPPRRLEHPAQGLGIPCSIHLSYGGVLIFNYYFIFLQAKNVYPVRKQTISIRAEMIITYNRDREGFKAISKLSDGVFSINPIWRWLSFKKLY